MGLITYGKSAISTYFLGKLSKEALVGGSLAIGVANITGYSIISSLATSMDGISSQACGAQQWTLIGQTLQCSIMILTLTCITISILWLNIEPVLLFCGQNPTISSIATTYLGFSLPDLIFTSLIISFKIFLRTQDVTLPFMFSATLAPFLHAIINNVVIHTFGLGIQGVALVGSFTNIKFLIILLLYLWFSRNCSNSWQGWWYELLVLFSGVLPNATKTIATYGIIIQATSLIYNFPYALSLAVSPKVGNELGANRSDKAKASSFYALLCAFITTIVATILTVNGSARPTLGAKINLVSFYVVGLPVALLMSFVFDLGLLGLLLGLLLAQIVRASVMTIVLARTNWGASTEGKGV
uniref:Polysaccharide biosynthesis protein C-terminal domain-containing protein n=1 Tax=Glycine max TaxID=3847 RepID=K7MM63_SOYBN